MPYNDRELLARVIKCEAGGEGDDGMRAVASVIMNRVNVPDGEYQRVGLGSLRNIVFQPGQFDCAMSTIQGQHNPQNIYNAWPEDIHYQIADWALGGGILNDVGTSLWFMNPFRPACPPEFPYNGSGVHHTRINQHCFFRPTARYSST
ncbi:cell wall hydrolase [Clostridia bacterium OttesenSCG-928-F22]|nr:cell wall hydrolase [Clostridia bacterium OttesenSCG-928-F22]